MVAGVTGVLLGGPKITAQVHSTMHTVNVTIHLQSTEARDATVQAKRQPIVMNVVLVTVVVSTAAYI